jgi:hypothetical protein
MVDMSLNFFDRSGHTPLLFLKRQVVHEMECTHYSRQPRMKNGGSIGKPSTKV